MRTGWISILTLTLGLGLGSTLGAPAATARFNEPYAVAVGAGGALFVADSNNNRVRRILSGAVSTLAGLATAGFLDGPAATVMFNTPKGLDVNAAGEIYISDHLNSALRVYLP